MSIIEEKSKQKVSRLTNKRKVIRERGNTLSIFNKNFAKTDGFI